MHTYHTGYSALDCLEVSCQLLFSMPCHWLAAVHSVELYVQWAVLRFLILPPSPLSVPCRRRQRDLWPVTVALCSLNCLKPCTYPVDHCATPASAAAHTKRQKPPEIRLKNSWNWQIILVPATIWQIFNVKQRQSTETELIWICWNLLIKTREITLCELISGEF